MTIQTDLIGANSWPTGPTRSGPMLGEVGETDAFVWAQARDAQPLTLRVYLNGAVDQQLTLTPQPSEGLCLAFHATGLRPGTAYEYDLTSANGTTPKHRLAPALGTTARTARVAFGSCFANWAQTGIAIFDAIAAEAPDVFVMTGDNSYLPDQQQDDDADMLVHLRHRNNESLRRLIPGVSTIAVWDDHDFGPNDTDERYAGRADSLANFIRMWAQRSYGLPGTPGVFSAVRVGPVEIFLLDDRYHRIERLRILGDEQFAWLKERLLRSDAPVKLVVSGSVMLPEFVTTIEGGSWEGWRRDAAGELQALLSHIEAHDIKGVVFATGDLHLGYLMHRTGTALWDGRRGPEYWEIVSSPLANDPWGVRVKVGPNAPTYDPWLIEELVGLNYGVLDVDLDRAGAELSLTLKDEHGDVAAERSVALGDLSVRQRPSRLAAVVWNNGKAYFFRGSEYLRYDIAADSVDPGYPLPIAGNWPGLHEALATGVDAGVIWPNGKAYFFKGNGYARYTVGPAGEGVDAGYPMYVSPNWAGLWSDGIDAGVIWPDGKAYFFRGSEYVRYDIAADRVDPGYPASIAGNWPGLAEAFPDGIDSAVVWPNGKAYFFKGDQYVRYTTDPATEGVNPGYPKPIAGNWPGLA